MLTGAALPQDMAPSRFKLENIDRDLIANIGTDNKPKLWLKRAAALFFLVLPFLSGCSHVVINKYDLSLPINMISNLDLSPGVCVLSIDGELSGDKDCKASEVNLAPGHHILLCSITLEHSVSASVGNTVYTGYFSEKTDAVKLEFDAEAGKKYKIEKTIYATFWEGKIVESKGE